MSHWRKYFDDKYIGAWDLEGKPDGVALVIKDVKVEVMQDPTGGKSKKPVVYFEKATKGMVLNKTNARTIAKLHGNDTDEWTGKTVTLYATTCDAFGETVDCVRIKEG